VEPRNYLVNAGGTPPTKPASPSVGYPRSATPGVNEATTPGPFWFYKVGEELRHLLTSAGLSPSDDDLTQVMTAVQSIVDNRTLTDESTATNYALAVIDGVPYLREG